MTGFVGGFEGIRSIEVKDEKSAVVQRSVLSQGVGDDIARCIAPLLPVL